MATVSWSEVKLFRKCMAAHDYKYHQRLRRKRKAMPLIRGTIVHEMLDALVKHKLIKGYDGPDPWGVLDGYEEKYRDLFAEEREEYGDLIGICTAIFEGYMRMYRKDKLTYERTEQFVATDLAPDIRLIGVIDKIVRDEQGRRWLMDHKILRSIPTPQQQFSELQLLIYFWAWERWEPALPLDGIMWDYARAKAPSIPEVLKSGELSKRANIDTDQYTYRKAIKEAGKDPKDYEDILEKLEGKENTFFYRAKLPKPPKKMIDLVVEDFRTSAVMIQRMKGIAPRNMSQFNCQGCEFRDLCEAEVRGHDAAFIKKAHYESRTRHGEELEDGYEDIEDY